MNARMTRTLGAVAAAVALTASLAACNEAKDAASNATAAAGSAAGQATAGSAAHGATSAAGGAAAGATSAGGSAAAGATSAGGSAAASATGGANGGAGSESKPAVPSTSIKSAGGAEVSITDAPILAEYGKYGYEKGHLGAPQGPVSPLPDRKGKYLTLKGGTIYWSEASGAHVVHGEIGDKWGEEGRERGKLGYPTSDETSADGAIKQTFQNGTITFKDGETTVS